MSYQLIISEKPLASKRIADALAEKEPIKKIYRGVPYYELTRDNKKIVVGCAVGHLFGLKEKEKGWNYPVFDLEWRESHEISKTAKFSKKYLNALKSLIKKADSFVNACDLDTEGELIFKNILNLVCKKQDANRMRFGTLTKTDLVNAYENMDEHIDFGLAEAGETRHFMDFMWGVNSSRALTIAIKNTGRGFRVLSSGRVQSPTLALLTHRELEIKKFKPKPYWQIIADIFENIKALHKQDKFWEQENAKEIYEKCKDKDAKVSKVSRKNINIMPPAPFNLTSLQTEAYKLFGFSPRQTLNIAQGLYLAAYISYPRTSSEKLPSKIGYKDILTALSKINEFKQNADLLLSKTLKPAEGKKTDSAHVAIYPTNAPPKNLGILNAQQKKLYSLIVKRFFATFGDPSVKELMEVIFDINGEEFVAKGARILKKGWNSLYEPFVRVKEIILPDLKENEIRKVNKLELNEDETKPPKRYTQGSVVNEMEKRGLGTKATRSNILQTLYDRQYITGKTIIVTELGVKITEVLENNVPELVSEELTRHFEKETEEIQEGKRKKGDVLKEAESTLTNVLEKFKKNEGKIGDKLCDALLETRKTENLIGTCPSCGGELRIIVSKATRKRFIGCSNYDKGCRTSFPLPQRGLIKPSKDKCKECDSPIIMVYTKGRRPWRLCINPDCPTKKKE